MRDERLISVIGEQQTAALRFPSPRLPISDVWFLTSDL
jgi:hypothetical protein